jgi:hypothetical protein
VNITTDLPATWQQWAELFVEILAGAALTIVTNPLALAAALVLLVGLTAAYIAPLGTPEDAPFLTEEEREASR